MVDLRSLETSFVPMLDEAGSPITSDLDLMKRDDKLNLEAELFFGIHKRFEATEWLDQCCTSHPDEFVPIGGPSNGEVMEPTQPYCSAMHHHFASEGVNFAAWNAAEGAGTTRVFQAPCLGSSGGRRGTADRWR